MTAILLMSAVQAAGGILNYSIQQGFNEQQATAFKRLYDQAEAISAPELNVPDYQEYGSEDPYNIQSYRPTSLPASEEGSLGMDEGMRSRQLEALDEIQRIYQEGGLDPQSQAVMNEAQMRANQNAQSQRAGVAAQAQRAGRGGTALDYLSQQQAGQADANRLNQASLDAGSSARMRALDAMSAFQSGSANLRNQDFGQQQASARARDVYNRFNTEMMNDALKYKIDLENQRNKEIFRNKQDVRNINTELQNKRLDQKNSIAQQRYQNDINRLKMLSDAQSGISNAGQRNTDNLTKGIGDVSSGLAQGFGAYSQYAGQKSLMDKVNKSNQANYYDNYPAPKPPFGGGEDDFSDIYDYYGPRKTYT